MTSSGVFSNHLPQNESETLYMDQVEPAGGTARQGKSKGRTRKGAAQDVAVGRDKKGRYLVVPLTRGKFARIDLCDRALTRWRWSAQEEKRTGKWYAVRGIRIDGVYVKVYMHREILGFPCDHTDHKDGDGLNNRRFNLRAATCSENAANMRRRCGSSPFRGVYKCTASNPKWVARITVNYETHYLGSFDRPEDAAIAYNMAALERFGEYAQINDL